MQHPPAAEVTAFPGVHLIHPHARDRLIWDTWNKKYVKKDIVSGIECNRSQHPLVFWKHLEKPHG